MSDEFGQLIVDIEAEAASEGPEALRELEHLRQEFGLAGQLIESRRARQLSQRDLAKLSGIPQSEISRIETGAGNPTYATITALLRPLGRRIQLVDDGTGVAAQLGGRAAKSGRPGKSVRVAKSARAAAGSSSRATNSVL